MWNSTLFFFQGLKWMKEWTPLFALTWVRFWKCLFSVLFLYLFTPCPSAFSSHFKDLGLSRWPFLVYFWERISQPQPSKGQGFQGPNRTLWEHGFHLCGLSLASPAERLTLSCKVDHMAEPCRVHPSLRWGGEWVHRGCPEICHGFRKRGWQVEVFSISRITLTTHSEGKKGHRIPWQREILALCGREGSEAGGGV